MKVFGICASPRNSTTHYVLSKAMDKLKEDNFETEMFSCQAKTLSTVCTVIIVLRIKNVLLKMT